MPLFLFGYEFYFSVNLSFRPGKGCNIVCFPQKKGERWRQSMTHARAKHPITVIAKAVKRKSIPEGSKPNMPASGFTVMVKTGENINKTSVCEPMYAHIVFIRAGRKRNNVSVKLTAK